MGDPELPKPKLTLATNPERLTFHLGEACGGGSADGMELCVMTVAEWTGEDGTFYPEQMIVFSRRSSDLVIKALVSYLTRDEDDRENDRAAKAKREEEELDVEEEYKEEEDQ